MAMSRSWRERGSWVELEDLYWLREHGPDWAGQERGTSSSGQPRLWPQLIIRQHLASWSDKVMFQNSVHASDIDLSDGCIDM